MTALLSESLYKGSYLPHIRLVLPYLIEIPSMPLQSKIGACDVSLFTDFKSGNYRRGLSNNFRMGSNQLPFAPPKRGKPHIFPREIGVMSVRVQICSRKIPGTGRAALCFGNGYFRGTPDKRMRGQQSGSFHNHITINVCLALESCCQMCYIKHRKRESHRSGSTP